MHIHCNMATAVVVCVAITSPGLTFGALVDRGGGLIYDTDLNITWLSNANHGIGSIYDFSYANPDDSNDGRMTWQNAMMWANNLSYYDSVRGVIYDDWRLPTALNEDGTPPCRHFNCTSSELGHLFYIELGGVAGSSINDTTDPNMALFSNIGMSGYWTQTQFEPDNYSNIAWGFEFFNGSQGYLDTNFSLHAWAVRDGDVYAVSTVPAPAAAWLFGSGLLGLIGIAKRKQVA